MKRYDAIVVGAGAAGGWAAKELCERGLSVLLLDAGPELPSRPGGGRRLRLLAKGLGILGGQHVQARCGAYNADTRQLFVDDRESPYTTPVGTPFNWFRGRQVGGRLHTWGRLAPRMSDLELKAASRDGYGVDWPLDSAELAPYYDHVERFLGLERVELTEDEKRFKSAAEDGFAGLQVLSAPVVPAEDGPVPRTIRAAQATGLLVLRPNAVVRSIAVDSAGRAAGVSFVDRLSRERHDVAGAAVVLCPGTIETLRLLLGSTSGRHPRGLGNSSGRLGQDFMDHVMAAIGGRVEPREPIASEFVTGFHIPRFRNIDRREPEFLRGYGLHGAVGRDGRSWFLAALGEMLPRSENRVALSPRVRDVWGMPVAHISCALWPNEVAMAADQLRMMRRLAEAAKLPTAAVPSGRRLDGLMLTFFRRRLLTAGGAFVPGSAAHEVGGAGMGNDPANFVLNRFNQCWDVPNVFVTDGACFTSGGWQNVTLTIMALTVRACERLAEELGAGRL